MMRKRKRRRQPAADPHTNEVCFLIGDDGAVLWADGSGNPAAITDSRARWDVIWRYRDTLTEIAHTHPSGLLGFSATDLATRQAVEAGLGRPLVWTVVTPERMLRARPDQLPTVEFAEPWWAGLLRTASNVPQPPDAARTPSLGGNLLHLIATQRRGRHGANQKGTAT